MVLSIKCFQGIRIKPDSTTCTQKGTPHGVPYRQYLREFDIPGIINIQFYSDIQKKLRFHHDLNQFVLILYENHTITLYFNQKRYVSDKLIMNLSLYFYMSYSIRIYYRNEYWSNEITNCRKTEIMKPRIIALMKRNDD